MNSELVLAIVAGTLVVFGGAIWTTTAKVRQATKKQANGRLQKRILMQCTPSPELHSFLGSSAGQQFMEAVMNANGDPAMRILGGIQAGLLLLLSGAAFMILRYLLNMNADAQTVFVTLSVTYMAIGGGFLVAAAVAHGLCKSWGLLPGTTNESGELS